MSGLIRRQMLRPASEVFDGARDLAGLGIDGRDTLTAAVGAENALGFTIVDNSVGIISHPQFVDDCERFEIENRNRPRVSGTDEAAAEFSSHGNAVQALLVRNSSNNRT